MEFIKFESLNYIINFILCLVNVVLGLIGIKYIKICLNVVIRFYFFYGYIFNCIYCFILVKCEFVC